MSTRPPLQPYHAEGSEEEQQQEEEEEEEEDDDACPIACGCRQRERAPTAPTSSAAAPLTAH